MSCTCFGGTVGSGCECLYFFFVPVSAMAEQWHAVEKFSAATALNIKHMAFGHMNVAGDQLQKIFGQAGDPGASGLLHYVKVFA